MTKTVRVFLLLLVVSSACSSFKKTTVTAPPAPDTTAVADLGIIEDSVEEVAVPPRPAEPVYPYRAEEPRTFDLIHTRLEVSFDWAKQYLHGEAELTLSPWFYPQSTLALDARGFDLHSVQLITDTSERPLTYDYDGEKITIQLERSYARTDTFQVMIVYTAKPNELPEGGSAAITSDKGLYFINPLGTDPDKPQQIWTQGETQGSRCWFPTIDQPNERCTQEMYITVDDRFKTLSNGSLIYSQSNADGTRTDYWSQELPHAPYLFMMAVGEFAVVEDEWRDLDVNYYVEPKYAAHAKAVFGDTPAMMEFFSQKLGVDYPWAKYAQVVVREYVSGAMENTSASVFMDDLQLTTRETLDTDWDFIVAHELFHQWFGDLVTCESWSNLALNEGFANYSEYLWAEHEHGRDAADYSGLSEKMQYLSEAQTKQVPIIRYHYADREDMFDSHSYAKAGRVIHMLRKYVGDEAFFESLRTYLTRYQFQSVEINNLRLVFEEVTGQDLNWFFNQWFLQPGHPQLRVQHTFSGDSLRVKVWQEQDTTQSPVFRLPLALEVWMGDQPLELPIEIEKSYQEFTFRLPSAPNLVLFDAEQQLLGTVEHQKTTDELIFQYLHSDKFEPRYEALDQLQSGTNRPQIADMMERALHDPFWALREQALNYFSNVDEASFAAIRPTIRQLALDDTVSSVRATALETLASFENPADQSLFREALQDRSYMVIAAALTAYVESGASDVVQVVQPFQKEDNEHIVNFLADYYAQEAQPENFTWFQKQLATRPAQMRYLLAQYLGQYLMNVPDTTLQQEGIDLLASLARADANEYVRLSSYQALGLLVETSDAVAPLRRQIKEEEASERLKRLYEFMP
ncbi:aminopeptidase N [Catalinimonas alkaloidigena]|uniref:Aminopeptidase N n=1 Tax=Catalinimonas alkaloidigena TaxID=1075417 RepID=A0A1G9Q9G3_9BACT|nr:M1 family aminopeptidase [Catalinimonas alkaloidigena]SDM07599.1 aminopeptidase N [Catalinimonas alkaloidigena]